MRQPSMAMEVCSIKVEQPWYNSCKPINISPLDLSNTEESSSAPSSPSSYATSVGTPSHDAPSPASSQYHSPQAEAINRASPDSTGSVSENSGQMISSINVDQYRVLSPVGVSSLTESNDASMVSGRSHRKHVGMRYLFPPLPDSMNLLDKTRIWVERHTQGYFVGWTLDQLKDVDKLVRPLCLVTEKMYKQHMNRSEHCRNIKLKYCLESNEPWAQEYREKLARPYTLGGFSGLCQAKICAADLWREHSENYKSHQARYPPSKRRFTPSPPQTVVSTPVPSQLSTLLRQQLPLMTTRRDSNAVVNYRPSVDSSRHICASPDDCHFTATSSGNTVNLLFPTFYNTNYSMKDKVNISLERFSNNYFVGWNVQKLKFISSCLRPINPISKQQWKNDLYENTLKYDASLHIMMSSSTEWAVPFKNRLTLSESDNGFTSLCEMKTLAYELCQLHANQSLIECIARVSQSTLPLAAVENQSHHEFKKMKTHHSPPAVDNASHVASSNVLLPRQLDLKCELYTALHDTLGHIFSPLPSDMSVFEQLNVWIERHRANFYLNYSDAMLMNVDFLCRPKLLITKELYKSYVPALIIKNLSKLATLFATVSSNSVAAAFANDIKIGRYYDLVDVMTKTEECWSTLQTPVVPSIPAQVIVQHQTSHAHDVNRFSPETIPNHAQEITDRRSSSSNCSETSESSSRNSAPTESCGERLDVDALDLSKKDEPQSLVNRLWSLRNTLKDSLQLNATDSWHDKLLRHMPLLRKHLGSNYKLPATAAECMADMTLITLHAEIQHYTY